MPLVQPLAGTRGSLPMIGNGAGGVYRVGAYNAASHQGKNTRHVVTTNACATIDARMLRALRNAMP
jgi:hypothetical protein